MKKVLIFSISLVLTLGILVLVFYSNSRDYLEAFCYDIFNKNEYIDSKKKIQNILSSFQKVRLKDLPKDYLTSSKINHATYKSLTKNCCLFVFIQEQHALHLNNSSLILHTSIPIQRRSSRQKLEQLIMTLPCELSSVVKRMLLLLVKDPNVVKLNLSL